MTTPDHDSSSFDRVDDIRQGIEAFLKRERITFDSTQQLTQERALAPYELHRVAPIFREYSMPTPRNITLLHQTGAIDTESFDIPQSDAAAVVIDYAQFTAIYGFYKDSQGKSSADFSIQPHESPEEHPPEGISIISAIAIELAANPHLLRRLNTTLVCKTKTEDPTPDLNDLRAIAAMLDCLGLSGGH